MSQSRNKITNITRRKLFRSIKNADIWRNGELEEPDFLARIDGLALPPYNDSDPKVGGAYDAIWRFLPYEPYGPDQLWIFNDVRLGDDATLLRFLTEMLHPEIQTNEHSAEVLLKEFNDALMQDGYELYPCRRVSGHAVYSWRPRTTFHGDSIDLKLEKRLFVGNPAALQDHLTSIRNTLHTDPAATITSCRDLLESLFKLVLESNEIEYKPKEDLPALYKKVAKHLKIDKESVPDNTAASDSSHGILRNLASAVQDLSTLRNKIGRGHGRTAPSPAWERHARLALNSTATVAEFVLDTWQTRSMSTASVSDD